ERARDRERWRKRSREMGESSASMGEELRLLQLDLDASTSVNQTNKIFKKIAAAADAGSCGNQTNSTTVLDLSKNKLLRRNPNFFRQSQEPEAFEPLTKRHLWIDPTQLSELDVLDLSNNKLSGRIPGSSQLDRLNDPNIYANNSKICGTQIQVSCSRTRTEQLPKEEDEEEKEATVPWEAVVIRLFLWISYISFVNVCSWLFQRFTTTAISKEQRIQVC
ncbi:unnamed protein product, partial [Brassica rapa subsp. narinosa]